jgi:argininosuccinate lyase
MQEDKEQVFDAFESLALSIAAATGMIRDLAPDATALRKAAANGYSTATDLADWLVRSLAMPFREAHHVTGRIVAMAAERSVPLQRLTLEDLQSVEPRINAEARAVLDVDASVMSRTSYGGTAPGNVRREAKRWLKRLEKEASAKTT